MNASRPLALALLVVLGACREEAAPPPPVRPVLSVVATVQSTETLGPFVGMIEPRYKPDLGFRVFGRMVAALGGPADFLEHTDRHLVKAPIVRPCLPERAGRVMAMDTRAIGVALIDLGGGRRTTQDRIDHRVGISEYQPVGAQVGADRPLCLIHAADEDSWNRAAAAVRAAVKIGENAASDPTPILDRIALD